MPYDRWTSRYSFFSGLELRNLFNDSFKRAMHYNNNMTHCSNTTQNVITSNIDVWCVIMITHQYPIHKFKRHILIKGNMVIILIRNNTNHLNSNILYHKPTDIIASISQYMMFKILFIHTFMSVTARYVPPGSHLFSSTITCIALITPMIVITANSTTTVQPIIYSVLQ